MYIKKLREADVPIISEIQTNVLKEAIKII